MEISEAPTQVEVPRRRGRPPKSRAITPVDLSRDVAVIDARDVVDEPENEGKPAIDLDGDVELSHLAMPYMPMNGAQAITLGGHFASGFAVSGVVKRIVLQRNGVARVVIEIGSQNQHFSTGKFGLLYFRDWVYAEPYHKHYADIDERTALGT